MVMQQKIVEEYLSEEEKQCQKLVIYIYIKEDHLIIKKLSAGRCHTPTTLGRVLSRFSDFLPQSYDS